MNPTLPQVTHPSILKAIGHPRLVRFLQPFEHDLRACNFVLPPYEPANDEYFCALADMLSSPALLPERLRVALFTLEAAAGSQNQDLLQATIQRRLPGVSLTGLCNLDRALELWFTDPEEFSQFAPQASLASTPEAPPSTVPTAQGLPSIAASATEGPPPSANPAPTAEPGLAAPLIKIQKSKIKNGEEGHPAQNGTKFKNGDNGEPPADQLPAPANPASSISQPASNASHLTFPVIKPWPEPVDGKVLLDNLRQFMTRFVVLPKWAAETFALWILHTYAYLLRDVSTYIGLESPEHRCGKSTLVTVLSELAHRSLVSSNISPPAFFRVIEDFQPTLFIDEADTFLPGNEQLRGILNSGYTRKTAFVLRASQSPSPSPTSPATAPNDIPPQVSRFSCWCPKVIARIGRLHATLADRCIVVRIQRKTSNEECERAKNLDTLPLQRQCARFVLDHAPAIASARPELPKSLNDRAADIWEPLFALADLAGGDWPALARQAAMNLSATAEESNPSSALLLDIFILFANLKAKRIFSRDLAEALNSFEDRPWAALRKGKKLTALWLSRQLSPYGIRPKTIWIGDAHAKGYSEEDCLEAFRRYIPRSDLEALLAELKPAGPPSSNNGKNGS